MGKDLISREALERIIQRAAELQASEHDIGDGLTKDEVLALGKTSAFPIAISSRRCSKNRPARSSRPGGGTGFWAWLTGPRSLAAQRVVQGDRATVERALARWMEEEESLQVKRRYPTTRPGSRKRVRSRAFSGRSAHGGAATPRLVGRKSRDKSRSSSRDSAMLGSAPTCGRVATNVCWVVGWFSPWDRLAIAAAAVLFGPIGLLPAVGLVPLVGGIARHHRADNERIHISLEQVPRSPGARGDSRHAVATGVHPLVRIAEEVRKALENPRPRPRGGGGGDA